jgi:hypothetical protein
VRAVDAPARVWSGASVVIVGGAVIVVMRSGSFINTGSGELGIGVQVANDGVLVQQLGYGCLSGSLLEHAVAEQAVAERVASRPVDAFTWVAARQADQPLQQAIRTHATVGDDRLRPGQRLRTDVLDLC